MYPSRDFLCQVGISTELAIEAALREPFKDMVDYYRKHNTPEILEVCEEVIKQGWENKSLHAEDLVHVKDVPDLYPLCQEILSEAWNGMKVCYNSGVISICETPHGVDIPSDASRQVLDSVLSTGCMSALLTGDGYSVTANIMLSKQAEDVYNKLVWIRSANGHKQHANDCNVDKSSPSV